MELISPKRCRISFISLKKFFPKIPPKFRKKKSRNTGQGQWIVSNWAIFKMVGLANQEPNLLSCPSLRMNYCPLYILVSYSKQSRNFLSSMISNKFIECARLWELCMSLVGIHNENIPKGACKPHCSLSTLVEMRNVCDCRLSVFDNFIVHFPPLSASSLHVQALLRILFYLSFGRSSLMALGIIFNI